MHVPEFLATIGPMADWQTTTVTLDGDPFIIQYARENGLLKVCVRIDKKWSKEAAMVNEGELNTLLHMLARRIVEKRD